MLSHLDRELEQVLLLGLELEKDNSAYPEPVRRAMRVAYSVHFRALLEFFHNGRAAFPRGKAASKRDMIVADLIGESGLGLEPNRYDKKRLRAADRLAAHLARDRTRYHASKYEWGNKQDRYAMYRRIRRLFAKLPSAVDRLPRTSAVMAVLNARRISKRAALH